MRTKDEQKPPADEGPVERRVRPREKPLPGGLRLTVTERCELYDWRDACVAEAEAAGRMAGVHSAHEQTALIVREIELMHWMPRALGRWDETDVAHAEGFNKAKAEALRVLRLAVQGEIDAWKV